MLFTGEGIDEGELAAQTGWEIKPEGACKGDVCVPLPPSVRRGDGTIDPVVLAERLGMPVLGDGSHGIRALGPATVAGRVLESAEAPELALDDVDGAPFRLSSLRGSKVLLLAWASW